MSEDATQLVKMDITYRRDPDAPVTLTLSNGTVNAVLYPAPLGGMHMRIPRPRSARRNALLSYPRSATSFSGRCFGRP